MFIFIQFNVNGKQIELSLLNAASNGNDDEKWKKKTVATLNEDVSSEQQ